MSPDAMSDLHAWRRRHVNGVTGLVTPVPGIGSWAVSISRLKSRKQHLSEHFPLLTDAQHAADRHACAIVAHDCSLCEQWIRFDRRERKR
jgi:hypothetical protein